MNGLGEEEGVRGRLRRLGLQECRVEKEEVERVVLEAGFDKRVLSNYC